MLARRSPPARSLGKLLLFFLKAGSLTFGSGLVIVPFLQQGLVQQYGWLDERQFLIAVAVGMISPGPVVITATFVGYLVAGFWGSLVSTIGIFLPSFIFILVVAPLLARHGKHPNVQGFVSGAYGAAIGTILGACILLGKIAIGDWLTALIGIVSLAILFRWKVSNPLLIAATAVDRPHRLSDPAAGLGHGEIEWCRRTKSRSSGVATVRRGPRRRRRTIAITAFSKSLLRAASTLSRRFMPTTWRMRFTTKSCVPTACWSGSIRSMMAARARSSMRCCVTWPQKAQARDQVRDLGSVRIPTSF